MSTTEAFLKIELEKARELRRSAWWKNIRAQGVCHYCNGTFAPNQITMDHKIPIASGGKSVKSNVVPCCKRCNTEKGSVDPLEEAFAKIKTQTDE